MRSTDPLLLDLPSTVTTQRLDLRVPRAGDGAVVHEAVAESLDELREFLAALPWVAEEPSVERSEAFCRNAHANFLARRDLPFLMFERSSGRLIGATGLHRPDWATPKVEVGYWRRSGDGGRGLVSEAVTALVDYAFVRLKAMRIELLTDAANAKARNVAERCGFALEGVLRHERRAPDGSLRNTCLYARCDAAT